MTAITILDNANTPMGPFTREEVASKLQRGEVTLTSLAFVEGLTQWTPLRDVLARVDGATPPPVPFAAPPAPAPVTSTAAIAPAYSYAATMEPPTHLVYAGFWLRFVAYFIDSILIDAVVFGLTAVIGGVLGLVLGFSGHPSSSDGSDSSSGVVTNLADSGIYVLCLVGIWLYFAILESSSWQATVGKKLLGLKVTTLDGRRISFGQATGRFFGKILSGLTLLIGYIMAGFTARKQALHDMIAGTLVVRNS
jgi:uncharacterized RDD family membrane protein YckC